MKALAPDSMQGVEEFKNEVKLLSKFGGQPNIVSIVGFVCEEKTMCILTPFFRLGSLQTRLDPASRLDFRPLHRVGACIDVANGISCLHAQDVLHLDLKPDNVLADEASFIHTHFTHQYLPAP